MKEWASLHRISLVQLYVSARLTFLLPDDDDDGHAECTIYVRPSLEHASSNTRARLGEIGRCAPKEAPLRARVALR